MTTGGGAAANATKPANSASTRVMMSRLGPMPSTERLAAWMLAIVAVAATAPETAAASRPLALGFFDPIYAAPATSAPWLQRTVDAGADVVKIEIGWPAATRPRDARDPADPAYDFRRADGAVRAASAHGLRVLVSFTGAPRWAEGARRPRSAVPGSWRPNPAAVGDYGAALARRYSGAFPDPAEPGSALPRVEAFQVWNEPNFAISLSPQWSGRRAVAPLIYRAMLNAFHTGVKSVTPGALVVTAGTAPFGDSEPGGARMKPARFWRGLLCQTQTRGGQLRAARCLRPARFDVLAHHPYPSEQPRWQEAFPDDVSISGMAKLTRILRAAQRSGRALPRGPRKRVWVTEVSYDSSPPDPHGVPLARHARWLQETLYLLWRAGVDTITWFRIVDEPPVPRYGDTNQSGLYRLGGRPKPAARAFRFPFVAERAGRRALRVWGRSPVAGRVAIERLRRGRWIAVRHVSVRRHGTFLLRVVRGRGPERLRARVRRERSLTWQAG